MIEEKLFALVLAEHERARAKHGPQNYANGTGSDELWCFSEQMKALVGAKDDLKITTWAEVLVEETAEALAEKDEGKLFFELIQVSATAMAWASRIYPKLKKSNKFLAEI